MKAIKENLKMIDIYGPEVIFEQLKKAFYFVSYAEKSIPTAGSMTKKSDCLRNVVGLQVIKTVFHKNGNITVQTDKGFLKFSN